MQTITTEQLRAMENCEGLVLQGCGGSLQEWVDGVNGLLREQGILTGEKPLDKVYAFEHDGLTNLLFAFGDHKLDMGKLAVWRMQTHKQFGGTWLSDYLENRLGGFTSQQRAKPDCPLIGENGNLFGLIGIASKALRENGMEEQAEQMQKRIMGGDCHSYEEALTMIADDMNITSPEPEEGMEMNFG